MNTLEQFVRRTGKHIIRDGHDVLITDGDPLFMAAFQELGWTDPHDDAPTAPIPAAMTEVAVESRAPEQAVLEHPSER